MRPAVPSVALVCLGLALLSPPRAGAAPLAPGAPQLSLRLQALAGQPTTLLGARGGVGLGVGWRLTDQIDLVADAAQYAAPGGGVGFAAAGVQATLDTTPISPYLELCLVGLRPRGTLGYSLATRSGFGADYRFSHRWAAGVVIRTLTPFNPDDRLGAGVSGLEGAVRLVFTPGGT